MKNNTIKIIKSLIEEKINSDPENYPNIEKLQLGLSQKKIIKYEVEYIETKLTINYIEFKDYFYSLNTNLDEITNNFCIILQGLLVKLNREKKL